jgi:hypothetical protein
MKSRFTDVLSSGDTQLQEIRYLKNWSVKLNEVLALQSIAEIQEEIDKQSISLVSYKETPLNVLNSDAH